MQYKTKIIASSKKQIINPASSAFY